MNLGLLPLLGGAVILAGCSTQATTNQSTPTSASVSANSTPQHTPATVQAKATVSAQTTPTAFPTSAPAFKPNARAYDKGVAYSRSGNFNGAVTYFRASVNQHQRLADSYGGLGAAYFALHDYPASYRNYKLAHQTAPGNTTYLYQSAFAALYARDNHGSVRYATQYLQLKPNDAAAYHLRFLAYGQLLDHKHQVQDARRVVSLQPSNADGYNDLGIALINDRQLNAAVAAFTRAIQIRPRSQAFFQNRAYAQDLLGNFASVVRDLEKARTLTNSPLDQKQLDQAIHAAKAKMKH